MASWQGSYRSHVSNTSWVSNTGRGIGQLFQKKLDGFYKKFYGKSQEINLAKCE